MGLQATINGGVRAAFLAAGDLVTQMPVTAPGELDPVTETETPGATGTILVLQLSRADSEKYFTGASGLGDVQASDVFLMGEVGTATLVPQEGYQATLDGAAYRIHKTQSENPAIIMLMLRRPK